MKQEKMKWKWHQLDHMQIICTSLQTGNHASTSSLNFKGPDAQRLLLGDSMPLTHGLSGKSFGSRKLDTLPTLLSGRQQAAFQFQVSLKQEGSASLAIWHVQIPGKIINELSLRRSNHQETGGDLEGPHVPPG